MKEETNNHSIRLEIGLGAKAPRTGFLVCAMQADNPVVDHVCAVDALPFDNHTVDEVFSRNIVEGFTIPVLLKALEEWNRVLKVRGKIYLICPNLIWNLKQKIAEQQAISANSAVQSNFYLELGRLLMGQNNGADMQQYGYQFSFLRDLLLEFGFEAIEDLTDHEKGLENSAQYLEIRAKKKTEAPDYTTTKLYSHF